MSSYYIVATKKNFFPGCTQRPSCTEYSNKWQFSSSWCECERVRLTIISYQCRTQVSGFRYREGLTITDISAVSSISTWDEWLYILKTYSDGICVPLKPLFIERLVCIYRISMHILVLYRLVHSTSDGSL